MIAIKNVVRKPIKKKRCITMCKNRLFENICHQIDIKKDLNFKIKQIAISKFSYEFFFKQKQK